MKRLKIGATTGVSPIAYGGNRYLQLRAPDAVRSLLNERLLAAETYRAAAAVEEGIGTTSNCAICVDALEGRIHLEFAERATPSEQHEAQAVLENIAKRINER